MSRTDLARLDPVRLTALRQLSLLDAPAEEAFDRHTRLTVRMLGVPAAMISLIDEDRDFYLSLCGAGEPLATTRQLTGETFCHHVLASDAPLAIGDARADPVYCRVPTVESLGVSAYLGVPLRIAGGTVLGTFCVIDTEPRAWSERDVLFLTEAATSVATEIQLRVAAAAAMASRTEAERARVDAEAANLAKSEFLSRMSHELRTPLNSILGFAQILAYAELATDARGAVQHILTAGEHLLNLINEVLDISRIEAGQYPLSLEPVRLGPVVQEVIGMVRPLAVARGVWIADAVGGAADRHVLADRQRLAQVLLNLLSNAVKYNRPGGRVTITSGAGTGPSDGRSVWIRVEDTGLGIPADRRDQLFVPFSRLGAERTGVEGTGLGMALSKRLVEAMGGALGLESSSGQGSTFRIDLRAAADPLTRVPVASERPRALAEPASREATLLYVEDNLANLTLVEQILESRPMWRLLPALQGRLGLELAAEHAPDVVLLDLHLPDMHGRDVLRRLRDDARTAATPVVVISADATPKTEETLLAEGADAFLTKPLDVRAFVATVERLLARAARGA